METFGYDGTPGTSSSRTNHIDGSWATCPEVGTADSISVYIWAVSGTRHVKCALYKRSDLSFVGATEDKEIGALHEYVTFNFEEPKPSLENIDYVLCVWTDDTTNIHYDTEVGKCYHQLLTYGDWPDSYDSEEPDGLSYKWCIYCTYTPSAAPQTLTPSPVAISLATPVLALLLTKTLAPDPATTSLAIPAPTLAFGGITLTPEPVVVEVAVPQVTVDVEGAPVGHPTMRRWGGIPGMVYTGRSGW